MASYNGYDLSPSPVNYSPTYGGAPGQISAPPSVWDELGSNVPGFSGLATGASNDISSELAGTLSPATLMAINNSAAAHGVSLGQPNSALSNLLGMNITGNTVQGLQNQGINNFDSFSGLAGSQQESPSLLANIAEENAVNASAPNPSSVAQELMRLSSPASGFTATNRLGGTPSIAGGGFAGAVAGANNNPLSSIGTNQPANPPVAYGPGGGPQYNGAGNGTGDGSYDPYASLYNDLFGDGSSGGAGSGSYDPYASLLGDNGSGYGSAPSDGSTY